MESNNVKIDQNPSINSHKNFIKAQAFLRVLASVATLAAALIMLFNQQTTDIGGFQLKASYKSSPAFKFFVAGNFIACGYSLISLFFVFHMMEGYIFNLLDLVSMGLVMGSASAAMAIAYVGKKGNDSIGWSKVCPYYGRFCNRSGISLVCSFLGFALFLFMSSLSSVYKTRRITN